MPPTVPRSAFKDLKAGQEPESGKDSETKQKR